MILDEQQNPPTEPVPHSFPPTPNPNKPPLPTQPPPFTNPPQISDPPSQPPQESFSCLYSDLTGNAWPIPPTRLYDITLIDSEEVDEDMGVDEAIESMDNVTKQIEDLGLKHSVLRH